MSYREGAIACPGCREVLDPTSVGEAVIDVCPGCGGLWIDWFDGELGAMVRGAPAVSGATPPPSIEGAECPRCQRPLGVEQHPAGAVIQRCSDCAGAFVSREAAAVIVAAEGPPPAGDALSRLAAALQRLFGWEDKPRG